jgi:hypothetical protein
VDFNRHTNLIGSHSFLSPSNNAWVNYDEDKLDRAYVSALAAKRGTDLHNLARDLIRLGVKLPSSSKTLNLYVNDAIGYRMTPEQMLYYSPNCFGTTDTISFRRSMLRIHDLKTGITPSSPVQVKVYAALFCLEYRMRPFDIKMELRLYQSDDIHVVEPDPDEIFHIMDRIVTFDKRINAIREEAHR